MHHYLSIKITKKLTPIIVNFCIQFKSCIPLYHVFHYNQYTTCSSVRTMINIAIHVHTILHYENKRVNQNKLNDTLLANQD